MYVHVNVYRHGLQTRRFNPCHKFLVDSCSGVYAYVNESMYAYVHVNLSVVYASVNVNINMYNVLTWFNFCDIYFVDSCSQNLVYVYVWMYTCMHMFTSIYMYTVLYMTQSYMRLESFIWMPWHIRICETTYLCIRRPSHFYVHRFDMGWLRLVGSFKSYVSLQNIVSFIGLFCKRDL